MSHFKHAVTVAHQKSVHVSDKAYIWLKGVPVALLLAFISIEITLFSAGTVSCDTCTPGCKQSNGVAILHKLQASVIAAVMLNRYQ